MKNALLIIIASLISPIAPVLLFGAIGLLFEPSYSAVSPAMFLMLMTYLFTLAYVIFLGVPCFFILRKLNKLNLLSIAISGFVIVLFSLIFIIAYESFTYVSDDFSKEMSDLQFYKWLVWFGFSALGAIVSCTFYVVVIKVNPNFAIREKSRKKNGDRFIYWLQFGWENKSVPFVDSNNFNRRTPP